MAKELPFFKFEISEWMFGRIQKQPEDIQGMFINLCCKYWHKLGDYSKEDADLDFGDRINTLVISKIVVVNNVGKLCIKFLDNQLAECAQNSQKQREKGLKSAEVRLTKRQQRLTSVEPNPTEENRREEIRKEDISIDSDYLIFGTDKTQPVVKYKKKYAYEKNGMVYGPDGYREFISRENMILNEMQDKHLKGFFRAKNATVFNDDQHLINSFNKYIEDQYK